MASARVKSGMGRHLHRALDTIVFDHDTLTTPASDMGIPPKKPLVFAEEPTLAIVLKVSTTDMERLF
jgi:hypothetical protein